MENNKVKDNRKPQKKAETSLASLISGTTKEQFFWNSASNDFKLDVFLGLPQLLPLFYFMLDGTVIIIKW